jgi:serine/threonine protein phosphatase PrpC
VLPPLQLQWTLQERPLDRTDTFSTAGDSTDPIMGAGPISESATLLRESGGVRLERVVVGDPAAPSDAFVRLTVLEAGERADRLRDLLLSLPEATTGFRDLLVADGVGLSAALESTEHSLASLQAAVLSGATYVRPLDLLEGLRDVAALMAQTRERTGMVWTAPSAEHVDLQLVQPDPLAAGYNRWRAVFGGWDALGDGDEAASAAALLDIFRQSYRALAASNSLLQPLLATTLIALDGIAPSSYAAVAAAAQALLPVDATLHGATDTGRRREHNEDACLLLELKQVSLAGVDLKLAAVADGMGGHNSGEVASSLALDLLRTQLTGVVLAPRTRPHEPLALGSHLAHIIPAIGNALLERAALSPEMGGMGTTLIGLATASTFTTVKGGPAPSQNETVLFWVGDSRAYLLGPCGIAPLSVDHSFVQQLVSDGQITRDDAFSHPQKNIITRCLGAGGSDSRAEVRSFTPGPGEIVLICSDGLSDALRDSEIWDVVSGGAGTLAELAQQLIAAANAAGGPDNITVVLASFAGSGGAA